MLIWVVMIACIAGCSSPQVEDISGAIPIRLERGDPERLLRFYVGSYVGETGGDPVLAGVLEERENSWFLRHPSFWQEVDTSLQQLYRDGLSAEEISKDLMDSFLMSSYYFARRAPQAIEVWRENLGDWTSLEKWLSIDVKGSMSPFPRRVAIKRSAVLSALNQVEEIESPILYPVGTAVIGEHFSNGFVVETTIMQKRSDGFWDFFAYDDEGQLVDRVQKQPDDMMVPIRCTGCHFGTRQYEPERSFPARVEDGPDGPRFIEVAEGLRNASIVSTLQEHAKRSDNLLGLYGTIYLSEIAQRISRGEATSEEIGLAFKFGIESASQ